MGVEQIDNKKFVVEKLARFVKTYGPEAHDDSLDKLMNEISWFLSRNRLITYSYENELVGISAGIRVSKAGVEKIFHQQWPEESSNGSYYYVRYVVIRDEYSEFRISRSMIHLIQSMFPGLKYIVYNSRKGNWHTRRIESFGGENGRRRQTTSS